MKFIKAEYNGPDGDGDVNFDFELAFENSSDHDIESVKTSCLITNQEGAVVGGSYGDEQDVFIEPGESEAFDIYCSYLKEAHFGGSLAGSNVLVDSTFYRAEFHKLGEHEVPSSSDNPNIIDNSLEIGDMLKVFKTGIFLDPVDDEGEVGMEVRIGVRNVSDVHFEKVEVKAELLDKRGSEVDTSEDYQVLNAFSSSFLVASFWGLKPSRLKGCTIKLSVLVHQPIAYGSQTAELSKAK